jgi:hypothetical protein
LQTSSRTIPELLPELFGSVRFEDFKNYIDASFGHARANAFNVAPTTISLLFHPSIARSTSVDSLQHRTTDISKKPTLFSKVVAFYKIGFGALAAQVTALSLSISLCHV